MTSDQVVADALGQSIADEMTNLAQERAVLAAAAVRITEIDAVLAILLAEQIRIAPRQSDLLVFIGDSITARWDTSALRSSSVNRGVPGDTTAMMLARFSTDVLALAPKAIHILGGANDVSTDTPSAANILTMASAAVSAGARTFVGTMTPGLDRPEAGVEFFNVQIRAAAQERGYTIIDYYPAMRKSGTYFDQSLFLDTVHPNASGYLRMDAIFRTVFR